MFTLSFRTDNAAFEDGAATETARILRDVARRLERGDLEGAATDHNGNRVGAFALNGRNPSEGGPAWPVALTEREATDAAHHLRIASERYEANAADLEAEVKADRLAPTYRQAAETFRQQAKQARELSHRFE